MRVVRLGAHIVIDVVDTKDLFLAQLPQPVEHRRPPRPRRLEPRLVFRVRECEYVKTRDL